MTEGDLLCIMSQWGEIEDSNLVRDEGTGKSKGFAFIKYCDQVSEMIVCTIVMHVVNCSFLTVEVLSVLLVWDI